MMLVILLSLTVESLQNRVATHFGVTLFIGFSESSIASIIAALMLTLGVNGPRLNSGGPKQANLNSPFINILKYFLNWF